MSITEKHSNIKGQESREIIWLFNFFCMIALILWSCGHESREGGKGEWMKGSSNPPCPSVLLCFHRKQDHKHIVNLMSFNAPLSFCEGWTWRWMNGCVLASVMIAVSRVKMSSCPFVTTSRVEIPQSHRAAGWAKCWGGRSRWKVQDDDCVPVSSPPFYFLFLFTSF